MAQRNELNVEDTALVLAHAANADGVPAAEIAIEARLGPVRVVEDHDGRARRARAAQRLGLAHVAPQRVLDVLGSRGRAGPEAQRDAGGVAVEHGDAVAGGGDAQRVLRDAGGGVGVEGAEDLARLGLELVLLAANEGHHVVQDVHAADARVPGPGHGLHRDHADRVDGAEPRLQRRERDHEPDHRAVRVAHQEALLEAVLPPLVGDEVEVRQVDRRHDEGHQRVAAVVLGVGEDGEVGLEELHLFTSRGPWSVETGAEVKDEEERRTYLARNVRVQPAEDDVAVCEFTGLALADDELADSAHGGRLLPPYGILIFLARGPGRGANSVEDEMRVLRQQQDEALSDGTRGAKHT